MGLDMYLYRKTYVKNWDHYAPESRHTITVLKGGQPRTDIQPERICHVVEQVAYWRKANAIHKWFVDNCQAGRDECQETSVEKEKLAELVELCRQVLATAETVQHAEPETALANSQAVAELLPTQGGFFFGGTEYNEYYLQDVQSTIDQLQPLLKIQDDEAEYSYRSSW